MSNYLFELAKQEAPEHPAFHIGIEVEAEGKNLPDVEDVHGTGWKYTKDGSLRGESAEYILRKPLSAKEAIEQLLFLKKISEGKGSKYAFSNRTSVHVHLNAMPFTVLQVANLTCLYYMFEDILLRYCGEDRKYNRFCLSVRDAEGLINQIKTHLNSQYIFLFRSDLGKYAALNLASISQHGSVEFRGMRGTLDLDVLIPWIEVIENLAHLAVELKSPLAILNYDRALLAKKVFGKYSNLFLFDGWENEVAYNVSICAELFYHLEELTKEKPIVKKAPVNKEVKMRMNAPNIRRAHPFINPVQEIDMGVRGVDAWAVPAPIDPHVVPEDPIQHVDPRWEQ